MHSLPRAAVYSDRIVLVALKHTLQYLCATHLDARQAASPNSVEDSFLRQLPDILFGRFCLSRIILLYAIVILQQLTHVVHTAFQSYSKYAAASSIIFGASERARAFPLISFCKPPKFAGAFRCTMFSPAKVPLLAKRHSSFLISIRQPGSSCRKAGSTASLPAQLGNSASCLRLYSLSQHGVQPLATPSHVIMAKPFLNASSHTT